MTLPMPWGGQWGGGWAAAGTANNRELIPLIYHADGVTGVRGITKDAKIEMIPGRDVPEWIIV